MLKKSWIFLLIGAVFLFTLIGFVAKSLAQDDKPKIVVVVKTLNTEYWKILESGANKAFQDFNVDGQVIATNYESQITEQVQMLERVFKQKPDALIIALTQPSSAISVLKEYKRSNIPVLFVDTEADWAGQTAYIGTDNYELGKTSGELLASMLLPGDQVALIHTAVINPDMIARLKGAREALEAAGIEIVAVQPADNESGEVKLAMDHILQTYPDIKGVFAGTDTIAISTLQQLKVNGIQIPVVGTDGTMKMVKSVEDGTLSATIAQNPYDMGYLSVEKALKAIKGEPVEKKVDSGVNIVIKGDVKERIDFLTTILK